MLIMPSKMQLQPYEKILLTQLQLQRSIMVPLEAINRWLVPHLLKAGASNPNSHLLLSKSSKDKALSRHIEMYQINLSMLL